MAVRRMTPLGQRLIAAGAQPERAQQFVQRAFFDKGAPAAMPSIGKPKAIDDAYNDELAAISRSTWNKGFVPPSSDAPTFKTYFDLVKGKGAYDKFISQASIRLSPNYSKALTSKSPFDQAIVPYIKAGVSVAEIVDGLMANPTVLGTRTLASAEEYVEKLYDEYNASQTKVAEEALAELKKDKNYLYALPDPRLRYGITTDLSKGTVDIRTHPAVEKAYQNFLKTVQGDPVASQKVAGWLNRAVEGANKAMETPWKNEVRRREILKKKTTRGG